MKMAQIAVRKLHTGTPPRVGGIDGDWEIFFTTVAENAWGRMSKFRLGGSKTIYEYAYKSCEFALRDLQREMMKDTTQESQPLDTPLLDWIDKAA